MAADRPLPPNWEETHSEHLRRHGVAQSGVMEPDPRFLPPGRRMIQQAVQAVDEHIRRQPHVQRLFSFMPQLMTRVSPFHLKSRSALKDWPLVRLESGDGINWGRMRVVGELLIIFDETVLFALLVLMGLYRSEAFETTIAAMCDLVQVPHSPRSANDIWKSLQRLAGSRIDLELLSGKGRRRKVAKAMSGSILSYADRDTDSGIVRVAVNPYFFEMYADSFVANIDVKFRAHLKKDISKALYRVFQGQVASECQLELTHLARTVNLDLDRPSAELRRRLRTGLTELQHHGYLERFQIDRQQQVRVRKAFAADFKPEGLPQAP